jgi:two-component system, OmpR family, osmolarity sensor histidine kinase EnvZ
MMKWRPGGLLLRLVLAQVVVIVLAFLTLVLLVGQQRGAATARLLAPQWAAALGHPPPATPVALATRPGPPPADASAPRALRYEALREELQALGVPVQALLVSRRGGRETTWLHLGPESGPARWVGFEGGVFGADEAPRRWPVIAVVLLLVTAAAVLLTWSVVRPLARLQRAVERYRDGAEWPASGPGGDGTRAGHGGPSELRDLERAFAQMAAERSRLEHDRTLMLAGVSHDLRSPLARIRLVADLLPDQDPQVAEARTAIRRNVDTADRHLRAFLDFAAPASTEALGPVDLVALWREAIALAVPEGATPPRLQPGGVQHLHTARRPLLRVLVCGLDNAVQHGGAPIELRALQRDGQAVLEIEDGGPGLPAHERQRVMRPFERGERARTTPGTGLGLALAAQIAQRLGGRVELDQADRGLIFRCVMPLPPQPSLGGTID